MAHISHKYDVSDDPPHPPVMGSTPAGRMPRFFGKARLSTACLSFSWPVLLTSADAHCFTLYMQLAGAAGAVLGRLSSNHSRHSAAEVPDEDVEVFSSKQLKHPNEARQASGIKAVRPQVSPIE